MIEERTAVPALINANAKLLNNWLNRHYHFAAILEHHFHMKARWTMESDVVKSTLKKKEKKRPPLEQQMKRNRCNGARNVVHQPTKRGKNPQKSANKGRHGWNKSKMQWKCNGNALEMDTKRHKFPQFHWMAAIVEWQRLLARQRGNAVELEAHGQFFSFNEPVSMNKSNEQLNELAGRAIPNSFSTGLWLQNPTPPH